MAFANNGSAEGTFSSVTSASDTVSSVAVPSLGANRVGVVTVALIAASNTPTGATWDGAAMSVGPAATDGTRQAAGFYLIGAAHNGSYNIVVTYSSSAIHSGHITVAWADATNTISLDDTSTATGTAQNPAITSTQATANELVVSVSASAANDLVGVTDCTSLQNYDQGGNTFQSAYSLPAGSGNATHTHNYGSSDAYAIASMSFREAGGATNPGWAGGGWW